MGFAVPAAMGVWLARPDEPVWAISGDGGFQMNMQEIATMRQEQLPVKLAIFNNGFGRVSVSGYVRVLCPAAMITACVTSPSC